MSVGFGLDPRPLPPGDGAPPAAPVGRRGAAGPQPAADRRTVGSLFSGIGGLDHGLARAGWEHLFLCESDEWRRGVLRERFPGVPVHDDVRDVANDGLPDVHLGSGRGGSDGQRAGRPDLAVDLLCGGFPCQDVSVAGQRRGLAGDRSGLFHEYARVAGTLRPRWLLIENVPGLLSSNGGRDFGVVLGTLADLGYGLGWRILDSRFFGVPQRRRRVFIVGALADGDPRAAAERAGQVLAVGSRCAGHPATRSEAGADVAAASDVGFALRRDPGGVGQGHNTNYVVDDNDGQAGRLVAVTLKGNRGKGGGCTVDVEQTHVVVAAPLSHGSNPNSNMAGRRREDDENLVAYDGFNHTGGGSKDVALVADGTPPLDSSNQGVGVVAFAQNQRGELRESDVAMQLMTGGGKPGDGYSAVREGASVRRLTPTECLRLQAMPDDWFAGVHPCPDSRMYAGLGDAVTASVGEWLGRRILDADRAAA